MVWQSKDTETRPRWDTRFFYNLEIELDEKEQSTIWRAWDMAHDYMNELLDFQYVSVPVLVRQHSPEVSWPQNSTVKHDSDEWVQQMHLEMMLLFCQCMELTFHFERYLQEEDPDVPGFCGTGSNQFPALLQFLSGSLTGIFLGKTPGPYSVFSPHFLEIPMPAGFPDHDPLERMKSLQRYFIRTAENRLMSHVVDQSEGEEVIYWLNKFDCWFLESWEPLFPPETWKVIRMASESRYQWKPSFSDLLNVYRIFTEYLYPLLEKFNDASVGYTGRQLIRNLHYLATYTPPGGVTEEILLETMSLHQTDERIEKDKQIEAKKAEIKKGGMLQVNRPPWLLHDQMKTVGYITLYLDDIRRGLDDWRKECVKPLPDSIEEEFICLLLVHEFTHALLEQRGKYSDAEEREPIKDLLIEESLAEWMELEVARHLKPLDELVLRHARSGKFPEWPYAGALLIDRQVRIHRGAARSIILNFDYSPRLAWIKMMGICGYPKYKKGHEACGCGENDKKNS